MTAGIDTTHQTFGGLRAVAEAVYGIAGVEVAHPSSWKRAMGLDSDKSKSLALAIEKYPSHHRVFALTKNAGLAEAALLTLWHRQKK